MGLFDRKKDEQEAQEITNLKEQVNKLKAELNKAEAQAALLERQNEGYKNEKALVTERLNAAQARVAELENQSGTGTVPAPVVQEETQIDTSEIESLKAELSRLKAINLDPNGEFNRIRAERDSLLNAVSVLKEKLSEAVSNKESSETIKALEEERDSYAEALDNCNVLLSTVKKAKTELQEKNKKLQIEVSELTEKLSDTESLLSDLKIKYSGAEQALKSAQNELAAVKQENEKLNMIKSVLKQVEHINEG